MAAVQREAIFAALFERIAAIPGLASSSRIWTGVDATASVAQPAAWLFKGDERVTRRGGMPPLWELEAVVVLAARVMEADPSVAPSTTINSLLDAFETVIARQPLEGPAPTAVYAQNPDLQWGTTLGGLCASVSIDGSITVAEGAVGMQSLCVIPLLILVGST